MRKKTAMNQKGVVLVVASVVVAVVLVLTGAYFSGVVSEKGFAERQRFVEQAGFLAEAGLSHGLAELRRQINVVLRDEVQDVIMAGRFQQYLGPGTPDSLDFLCDFAEFICDGDAAILNINPLLLGTDIEGNYTARIIVRKQRDENGYDIEAYSPSAVVFRFPYQFMIEADGIITREGTQLQRRALRWLPEQINAALGDEFGGRFVVLVQRGNFARFALFTSIHRAPGGSLVWFTERTNFTGPVHTNDRFSFANNPGPSFSEQVTQHDDRARFYNNGWTILMDADSNPPRDVPSFASGFERGVGRLELQSVITQADVRAQALGDMTEPVIPGIYLPNDGTALTGGIYIRGTSTINMATDAVNNPVYTITRGGTTNIITLDYANNQTIVQEGADTATYSGLPYGRDSEGVIIYTNDNINSFSGMVQADTQVTISSERDIVITDHIYYQQFNAGPPPDAEGYTNLLGIISWGRNVRIGTTAPDDLQVHGVVMAPNGVFTVDGYNLGAPRGVVGLLGGVITNEYGPFGTFSGTTPRSGYGRDFVYDARMLEGMHPPYFPILDNFISSQKGLERGLVWDDWG